MSTHLCALLLNLVGREYVHIVFVEHPLGLVLEYRSWVGGLQLGEGSCCIQFQGLARLEGLLQPGFEACNTVFSALYGRLQLQQMPGYSR